MGKINILGFDVANMIAAGEVVDRPSSVVKELMENAVDAGSTQITVEIARGGISSMRVSDNGCGMDMDDLPTALLRHATSKIKTAEDLAEIGTLGFRGEALAAISSVSRVRIFSKTRENSYGALLEADGGEISSIIETGCSDGTTVIVEDLFFNVPARRKFLKKDSTEATAIGTVMEKIALSRPDISIKFISDGEIKFMTSGNGSLADTIWALFGRESAKRMHPIDREENGIKVSGFVSATDFQRSNRNMQNFFINGRYVKSKTASAALEQAYTSRIPSDKFPSCVINIQLNPAAVDVNVHPSKLEVKFANEKLIFDAVYYAVLTAVQAETDRPELRLGGAEIKQPVNGMQQSNTAPRPRISEVGGRSMTEIRNAFVPLDKKREGKNAQSRQVGLGGGFGGSAGKAGIIPEPARPEGVSYLEMIRVHREAMDKAEAETADRQIPKENAEQQARQPERAEDTLRAEPLSGGPSRENEPPLSRTVSDIDLREVPEYIIIGEAFNCYVLVQLEDRILMIDKHAAHERIIFDELCRKMKNTEHGGQLLLTPYELTVSNAEADALTEYGEKIRALGFNFTLEEQSAASKKAMISQIPDSLSQDEASVLFTTLTNRLSDLSSSVESTAAEFFESRLWQASCKAAIKGGRVYDIAHLKWICDRLLVKPDENHSAIRTCPHGRPVAFEIKKSSITRQFERT